MDRVPDTPFSFFPNPSLVDDDLELIAPDAKWIDAILRESSDRATQQLDPRLAQTTRKSLTEFLLAAPGGLVTGDLRRGQVPAYHFWMRWRDPTTLRYRIVGGVSLRVGQTPELQLYAGHIGYHVYPTARGRHFAERASRLLLPLIRHHQLAPVWITCNPDNYASRRTCERLGATYVETVDLPVTHPFFSRGERQKCRFQWDV